MFTSISRPDTTATRLTNRRGFAGTLALTLAACLSIGGASTAAAQQVPPAPLEPGFSTMGVFMGSDGPVYAVTNLAKTSWNGLDIIVGNLYNFETNEIEFMVVVPAAPASVVAFTRATAFVIWADYGSADHPEVIVNWADNKHNRGTYIPL